MLRPWLTDATTRKYFLPALACKLFGALALGFIYQFYYDGGDTFNYHAHGSRVIWEAFWDDPAKGLKLIFSDGTDLRGIYKYVSKIPFFTDPASYAIVRIATLFDFFTFSTYSATALLFAWISFLGLWCLFLTFYTLHPKLHAKAAIAVLFMPSVIFWGSGLLKDTLTLACIGFATLAVFKIFIERKPGVLSMGLLLLSLYLIYVIKIYIFLCLVPAFILWIFLANVTRVRNIVLRIMLFPLVLVSTAILGIAAIEHAGQDNEKYAIESLARTAQITAYDIRYWTGREAGSGYTLGELDGTWGSMLRLAPQAINVSIFRPYLWEVRNPLMLLSALESLAILVFTLMTLWQLKNNLLRPFRPPLVWFCFAFSIPFAFAVGVSTFNFGTLTRYKIPLIPFLVFALFLLEHYAKRDKKFSELEDTE